MANIWVDVRQFITHQCARLPLAESEGFLRLHQSQLELAFDSGEVKTHGRVVGDSLERIGKCSSQGKHQTL